MNYEQAVQYIHDTKKFGSKLGLTNITKLLDLLGNPQDKLTFVHVAGTNGKGSVCTYIASALVQANYKTGLFISPYIEKFTERIQIDFNNMKDEHLIEIVKRIQVCVNLMLVAKMNHPTEFEINTAIAMVYFNEQHCDVVVLETGLGGRFDSTNVISKHLVSVITALGLDHVAVLGDSIEKIAFEKAGIIKENCPVVIYGDNDLRAIEMVKHVAKVKNAQVTLADINEIGKVKSDNSGYTFDYKDMKNIQITLKGNHQIKNCITAIEAIGIIKKAGYSITEKQLREGLKKAYWPGRLELLSDNPMIICDGAHNVNAAYALRNYLDEYFPEKKIIFVMGVMRNKAYNEMAEIIIKDAKAVICIEPLNERSLDKNELAAVVKKYCQNVLVSDTIHSSLDKACELYNQNDLICTFGSLYYIADVKKYVREKLHK